MAPADADLQARKDTVRRRVLAARGRVAREERAGAARAIAERLLEIPEYVGAGVLLGFASFGTEVGTDAVMEGVLAAGKRLLVPYVDGARMRAAEVHGAEELAPGYRGIREPVERAAVDAAADVVLVPGVAFDASGRRLGYGGGFYDVFLAELGSGAARIGLCFDVQVVEHVPSDERDQRVGLIVTERRVIRCEMA